MVLGPSSSCTSRSIDGAIGATVTFVPSNRNPCPALVKGAQDNASNTDRGCNIDPPFGSATVVRIEQGGALRIAKGFSVQN